MITSVDKQGQVKLTLNSPINDPSQLYSEILASKNNKDPILGFKVIEGDKNDSESIRDLSFTWSLLSVSESTIEVKLNFKKPFEISQGLKPDLLGV